MSSSSANTGALMPFGLRMTGGQLPYYAAAGTSNLGVDLQRAQLQDYAQRLQLGLRSFPGGQVAGLNPLAYHGHLMHPYLHPYFCRDPRTRFVHEEPKPNHSYIGLIAMAILSHREKKLVLSDIYQWILDNYSYFRTRGPGWRNSIRHNLSLNDCFIKSGRSANGKGHYWAIHPANLDDFQKGDFRRRRAQRRVRKHMGLSVPDDEDDDSPTPSPAPAQPSPNWVTGSLNINIDRTAGVDAEATSQNERTSIHSTCDTLEEKMQIGQQTAHTTANRTLRRQFDVESLLAPDSECYKKMRADMVQVHSASMDDPSDIFVFENMSRFESQTINNGHVNSGHDSDNGAEDSDECKDNAYINTKCMVDVQIAAMTTDDQKSNDNKEFSSKKCCEDDCIDSDSVRCSNTDDTDKCNVLGFNSSNEINECSEQNAAFAARNCISAPSTPENLSSFYSENGEIRQHHITPGTRGIAQGFFNISNIPNSPGNCYSDNKHTAIRSVGQMTKFPTVHRQGLLGAPIDIEAAHRWQQSMAALLMKAQMKGRLEPLYQIAEQKHEIQ